MGPYVVIRVRSVVRWLAVVAIALAAGLLVMNLLTSLGPVAAPVAALPLDASVPDFTLPSVAGNQVSLSAYKGRPVLLIFWTTWCPGCVDDLTALDAAVRDLGETSAVTVLAVNIMESRDRVEPLVRQHGWSFPVLLDADGAVSAAYRVRIAPTALLIDGGGLLRDRLLGSLNADRLIARLAPLANSSRSRS